MNNEIMMIIISGDGNVKEGLTTVILGHDSDKEKSYQIIDVKTEEDLDTINTLMMTDIELENKVKDLEHIEIFKDYLRRNRHGIFSESFLTKFKSDNEDKLFTIFSSTGNITFHIGEYVNIIYLPRYISDEVKKSLYDIGKYMVDRIVEVKKVIEINKFKQEIYNDYNDFLERHFNNKKIT